MGGAYSIIRKYIFKLNEIRTVSKLHHLFIIDYIDQFSLLCDFRFGILPYRKPIHVVVGAPIQVDRIESPSKEDIEELHTRYVNELTKLYDKYNPIYGDVDIKLVID